MPETRLTFSPSALHGARGAVLACAVAFGYMPWAQADGLKIRAADAWPTWQARVGIIATETGAGPDAGRYLGSHKASLLGDYYFTGSGFDPRRVSGGLRATSGWLLGGSGALQGTPVIGAAPFSAALQRAVRDDEVLRANAAYLGIGYTGLHRSGLGFTADFGLLGTRMVGSRLETDYVLRDIRLTPTVRLGMSYTF